ncbi:hypothetical protein DSL72_004337 [Monilinia vaccinii-corymbosi]|uniref:Uncharacterized protein n=1 Tax=Monilinia vaccinii-corymbosi TaxID=61207 RepID=A0A8A3P8P9_9HELO|nr:hypothetical protein DSL72_004337 [Monilinia vaccinii-corymbosi]
MSILDCFRKWSVAKMPTTDNATKTVMTPARVELFVAQCKNQFERNYRNFRGQEKEQVMSIYIANKMARYYFGQNAAEVMNTKEESNTRKQEILDFLEAFPEQFHAYTAGRNRVKEEIKAQSSVPDLLYTLSKMGLLNEQIQQDMQSIIQEYAIKVNKKMNDYHTW